MGVILPHEGLGAGPWRSIGESQSIGHGRLDGRSEGFGRPTGHVVQFIAGPQQEVVGRLHLLALGGAEEFSLLEVHQ